jgi:bifunctional ADP-heptose synthase (sugar kinase/adenylyltransferase)
MMNLSALGAEVLACGVTGKDEAREIALGLLL